MARPVPAVWTDQELEGLQANYPDVQQVYGTSSSKYNPTPGTSTPERRLFTAYCEVKLAIAHCIAGVGRTGYINVPPNNYPFYSEEERYVPIMQADGGQLSGDCKGMVSIGSSAMYTVLTPPSFAEWKPMYQPDPEQAEKDRRKAYEAGVPHGSFLSLLYPNGAPVCCA